MVLYVVIVAQHGGGVALGPTVAGQDLLTERSAAQRKSLSACFQSSMSSSLTSRPGRVGDCCAKGRVKQRARDAAGAGKRVDAEDRRHTRKCIDPSRSSAKARKLHGLNHEMRNYS